MKALLQNLVKHSPGVPPELDLNVTVLYNGTCVITGNNYSWGTRMVAGAGIETCILSLSQCTYVIRINSYRMKDGGMP